MVSRAALLKRNPTVIAARALMEKNAVNPDRADLDSLTITAMGDKSVQVRAEVMITVPLNDYLEAVSEAQERIASEDAAAARAAEAAEPVLPATQYDEMPPADEPAIPTDDEDGF